MSTDIPVTISADMASCTNRATTANDIESNATGDGPAAPTEENPFSVDENIPKTSPTAYSFSGSVLSNSTNNTNTAGNSDAKPQNPNGNDAESGDSIYECNICLETAKDAVVSMCGHLYCWPCLHQWLETRPNRKLCPVCKAVIGRDKVIPLYGRNSSRQEDPRNKVPPRPASQRTEPEPQQGFQGFGFMDGFHLSFGIGAFPFGYFASFNFGEPRPAAAARGTAQYEDEQQLSKFFLYVAIMCIAWLLFA